MSFIAIHFTERLTKNGATGENMNFLHLREQNTKFFYTLVLYYNGFIHLILFFCCEAAWCPAAVPRLLGNLLVQVSLLFV
jgi:hypothetical protein